MQIVTNIALISINETLIVQLVSFLLFLFIINRVMIRPLRGVMSDREQHIVDIKEGIVEAQKDLVEKARKNREKEDRMRAEALKFENEMEAAGQAQAMAVVAQAEAEIARMKQEAEDEIEVQLIQARKKIQKDSEPLALHIMEKVLERSLNP
jgi:F-type H+-transporting ATPase subunit b